MLGQSTDLLTVPGAKPAIDYLVNQVAKFQLVPARIARVQDGATQAKATADATGDTTGSTHAALTLGAAQQLLAQYTTVAANLSDVLQQLRASGALSGPVDLALAAINVSAQMTAIFSATDLLESGSGTTWTPPTLVTKALASPSVWLLAAVATLMWMRRRHVRP